MIDDDELGSRLARLDPAMSHRVDDDTLDQMLREVTAAPRRRPRHLKLVTTLVVGGVVLAAGAQPVRLRRAVAQPELVPLDGNRPGHPRW